MGVLLEEQLAAFFRRKTGLQHGEGTATGFISLLAPPALEHTNGSLKLIVQMDLHQNAIGFQDGIKALRVIDVGVERAKFMGGHAVLPSDQTIGTGMAVKARRKRPPSLCL